MNQRQVNVTYSNERQLPADLFQHAEREGGTALEVKRSDRHLFSRRRCDVIRDGHLSPFITLEKGGSRAEVIATKKNIFFHLWRGGKLDSDGYWKKKIEKFIGPALFAFECIFVR